MGEGEKNSKTHKFKIERTGISMWFIACQIILTFSLTSAYVPKKIDIPSKNKITIGGLFPVHHKGKNETEPCGAILAEKGIQRLEAMLYAIDKINNNPQEWGFNLGVMILDTCSSDSFTLEQSLQFLQINCGDSSSKRKVAGIIGASNSAVSEAVANIFRLFKVSSQFIFSLLVYSVFQKCINTFPINKYNFLIR